MCPQNHSPSAINRVSWGNLDAFPTANPRTAESSKSRLPESGEGQLGLGLVKTQIPGRLSLNYTEKTVTESQNVMKKKQEVTTAR